MVQSCTVTAAPGKATVRACTAYGDTDTVSRRGSDLGATGLARGLVDSRKSAPNNQLMTTTSNRIVTTEFVNRFRRQRRCSWLSMYQKWRMASTVK